MILQSAKTKGFTLVELIVTILISIILMVLVMSWYSSVKDQTNGAVCVSNLKNIVAGALSYAYDRNGFLWTREDIGFSAYRMEPDPLGLPQILKEYMPSQRVWLCPGGRWSLKKFGNNYSWTTASFVNDSVFTKGIGEFPVMVWDAYRYSLPSQYNASDNRKPAGESPSLGPEALNALYNTHAHRKNKVSNWAYLDGRIVSGTTANRK